jgi:hypothetical protein
MVRRVEMLPGHVSPLAPDTLALQTPKRGSSDIRRRALPCHTCGHSLLSSEFTEGEDGSDLDCGSDQGAAHSPDRDGVR